MRIERDLGAFVVAPDEELTAIALHVAKEYEPIARERGPRWGPRPRVDLRRRLRPLADRPGAREPARERGPLLPGGRVSVAKTTDRGARVEVTDDGP
jgi:hypothetical protein